MNNTNKNNLLYYLEYFQNPHLDQKYLHIAGTKGKTSVAYYLYQILVSEHKTAGLFISPHVFSERERIQRNGQMILEEELLYYRNKISHAAEDINVPLSFFEEFLLISFLYFKDYPVEFIVLEVGIGGRYDTTNIIEPYISIISRVKKDHQEILGTTLFDMFWQKLGIIKPNVPFIVGEQNLLGKIYTYFITFFKRNRLPIQKYRMLKVHHFQIYLKIQENTVSIVGPYYMIENFVLAYTVIQYLGIAPSLRHFEHEVPGRMQNIPGYKNAYLDGAHNEIAIKVLIKTLNKQFPNASWKIILCIREDKDIKHMLSLLAKIAKEFIILPWNKEINPKFNPNALIIELKKRNLPYQYVKKEILNKYLSSNDNILVTGSFYHLPIIYNQLTKEN